MMRLDKYLAHSGIGTRSQVKKDIRSRCISVNDEVVTDDDMQIDENADIITHKGIRIEYKKYHYYMLNKPSGYITATSGKNTVMDLIDEQINGLFPVGRLDKDTTGLLVITDDGPLSHLLLSPRHHVDKEYVVEYEMPLSEEDIYKIREGIMLEDGTICMPAALDMIDDKTCHIIIRQGMYHQIKRMWEAIDNKVINLKRIRMNKLILDNSLKEGQYRELTEEEFSLLCDGIIRR